MKEMLMDRACRTWGYFSRVLALQKRHLGTLLTKKVTRTFAERIRALAEVLNLEKAGAVNCLVRQTRNALVPTESWLKSCEV